MKFRTAAASLLLLSLAGSLAYADDWWVPIPLEKAASKIGSFKVLLAERSPLSKPADVAQRISQKAAPEGDYDLAKEPFDAYVPKTPAEDGKYGLMIVIPFPVHGAPPPKWVDVLESHHLIWLGDGQTGKGRPEVQRIGLALDAVQNAEKIWKIDPARVYVCPANGSSAADGIALYYPEVFQGQISGNTWGWYAKINDTRDRIIFNTDIFPPPHPEQLSLAKSRSRFFFARRPADPGKISTEAVIVKEGYQRAGFKHVKEIIVPGEEVQLWSHYAPTWFDQGVTFLDSGANAPSSPAAAATPAATANPSTPPAAATPDDSAKKAASALSLAKNYVNAGQFDAARKKLQSLLQTYPNTPAAAEARSLLKEIQDK